MRTTLVGFSVVAAAVLAGCGGGSASYAPSSPGGYYAPTGNTSGYAGYPAPSYARLKQLTRERLKRLHLPMP